MLNKKEMLILSHLRKNARQSLVDIAKSTKIPVSTIYDKVKSYEKSVIKKNCALLDFSKLGFNIRLSLLLKIKDKDSFKNFLIKNMNVNSAYMVDSVYNFWVDCVFKDMNEMQEFMDKAEEFGIEGKQVNFVTNEIKRESFLENPEYLNKI